MSAAIGLNPELKYRVITVGEERTRVLVVDDFLTDVNVIYDHVRANERFAPEAATYYPGIRAKLPRDYGAMLLGFADDRIRHYYPVRSGLQATPYAAFYSIVTCPEDRLSPLQRIPHFDRQDQNAYAVMHYIAPGKFGGTGFFRHKPTGFERIDQARFQQYVDSREAFFGEHGEPSPAYITASTDQFELIGSITYKPNRLLIYPGNLLHSGLINPETDIYSGQGIARLTGNIFIHYV